jgi:hypothetical protein
MEMVLDSTPVDIRISGSAVPVNNTGTTDGEDENVDEEDP